MKTYRKTAEQILRECYEKHMHHSDPLGFQPYIYEAIQKFASQSRWIAVEKRNAEMRDFLFNMHEVKDGKIILELFDILNFLPPLPKSPQP